MFYFTFLLEFNTLGFLDDVIERIEINVNDCLEDRGSFSFLLLFSIKLYEHQEFLATLLLYAINQRGSSSGPWYASYSSAASNDDNVSQCKASVGEKITVSVLTFDYNCQTKNVGEKCGAIIYG